MKREAVSLFEKAEISDPAILTIEEGSAYAFIVAEPTVWIVDRSGRIVSKHSGYKEGDEMIYRDRVSNLLERRV